MATVVGLSHHSSLGTAPKKWNGFAQSAEHGFAAFGGKRVMANARSNNST
ncbi:MAG: hypothetical protein U0791_16365 [Gemmataceae bacterium]